MAAKALPAQDVLNQLLSYDPKTGQLTWRERGAEWFNATPARSADHTAKIWNLRYAGKPALDAINSDGYRHGHLLGKPTRAHRVIWKMLTGEDADQVDHEDGQRANNRWCNLEDVSQSGNQRNSKRRRDNSNGVVGVYWYPYERKTGKWVARIADLSLGYFNTFDEAVAARKAAEVRYGFHPNHGRN